MSFLTALGLLIGIASGILSIVEFLKKRSLPGIVYGALAAIFLLAAILISHLSSTPGGNSPGNLSTPHHFPSQR